ncbi:MAG: hypothetical protein IT429_22045 [Gemmataceae bacterium]|nr:hypothetical protein [Gemmataceae bacterium]
MSFRWLASLVGVKAGNVGKVGIRRKAAPEAQRALENEIQAHTLPIRRVWVREVNVDGQRRQTVLVRADARGHRDVEGWLAAPDGEGHGASHVETSWLLLRHTDEAVLAAVVVADDGGDVLLRASLRFSAVGDRRALDTVEKHGRLALFAAPLRWTEDGSLATPHVYLPVDTAPLRDFLRSCPVAVV